MNLVAFTENLTNPALLFFILGIIAVQIKSDLKIPENSGKFISAYLLLSIGFKGGQELSHSALNNEIFLSLMLGLILAFMIPLGVFFLLKKKLGNQNAGAIAASYGSVSAVTFVTAISFLDMEKIAFDGHMVAVMATMEAPAIIMGVLLLNRFKDRNTDGEQSLSKTLLHSMTNGSVFLLLGSLLIGFLANENQAEGIKPFTTDIFKGFLAVFLLDMGITSGKQLHIIFKKGPLPFVFSLLAPFVFGIIALLLSREITDSVGNQLLFSILGASASYIAVPAAMRNAAPRANPSLYVPMALGLTFPINVMIGIPFYYFLINAL
jgi:hypothetical protein